MTKDCESMKTAKISFYIYLMSIGVSGGFLFNFGAIPEQITVSNPVEVPSTNVAIVQTVSGGRSIQSRYTSTNDWKGIGQAFTWNGSADLDGVGFYIDDAEDRQGLRLQLPLRAGSAGSDD